MIKFFLNYFIWNYFYRLELDWLPLQPLMKEGLMKKIKKTNTITEYFLNYFEDGEVKATKDYAYFQALKVQKIDRETYEQVKKLMN